MLTLALALALTLTLTLTLVLTVGTVSSIAQTLSWPASIPPTAKGTLPDFELSTPQNP